MNVVMLLLGAVGLLVVLYGVVQYNGLVALRNHIRDSWGTVETELKRRYDLIPNLVATVQGYARHERELLERVTQLRNRCEANIGRVRTQGVDETALVHALDRLWMVAEAYPELKADRQFCELQQELVNTEDRIQAARRFYNGNVRDYRNKCESFPSNLIASMFGFGGADYFTVEPSARATPVVDLGR